MENSTTSKIEVQGKVILKMTSGKKLTLNNILYVSDIRKIVVPRLLLKKHYFYMVFELDMIILSKSRLFIGKGYVSDRIFNLM